MFKVQGTYVGKRRTRVFMFATLNEACAAVRALLARRNVARVLLSTPDGDFDHC